MGVDGGYHKQMEEAFYPLQVMNSYLTIFNIKGKKPLITWYADNKSHAIYRNLTNG